MCELDYRVKDVIFVANGRDHTMTGKSGLRYGGTLNRLSANFNDVACVYVILTSEHKTVYVGETGELATRLQNHHKRSCWSEKGASYVFVHLQPLSTEANRQQVEADILANYHFPCND